MVLHDEVPGPRGSSAPTGVACFGGQWPLLVFQGVKIKACLLRTSRPLDVYTPAGSSGPTSFGELGLLSGCTASQPHLLGAIGP